MLLIAIITNLHCQHNSPSPTIICVCTGCADLGDALINEACSVFVQYVKDSNEYYYDKPNSALQQYIRQTPAPTAQ